MSWRNGDNVVAVGLRMSQRENGSPPSVISYRMAYLYCVFPDNVNILILRSAVMTRRGGGLKHRHAYDAYRRLSAIIASISRSHRISIALWRVSFLACRLSCHVANDQNSDSNQYVKREAYSGSVAL